MDLHSELARERRARLAAERLLTLRQQELHQANEKLGKHANALTEEIVEKREEAIELRDQTDQALQNLEKAQTEVHIAKRRLWDSIETIEDGFAVFDKDDRMIIANTAYLSVFEDLECVQPGISYQELALLMIEEGIANIGDLAPMDWVDSILDRWKLPQPAPRTIELWNGVHIKMIDRRSADGDTVSLALNITDTIRYERKLKRASHRAQAASRAKSAFLARMSHELRTPMNGVLGMAELLSETTLDDEQELYIETIRSSSEALLQLINDVLDFSKMEAARLTLKPAEFDLEDLILGVVRLFQSSKREKGLEMVIDYDMFLPTIFEADAGRLRQVLTNLLGNAVKFTEAGRVEIKVTGAPVDSGFELHVMIQDTGIGIPQDKIKHVFGEFNQVEDEKNRKFEGTGLGLAITRQIIELMQGEIWVESVEGEGSVFGFKVGVRAKPSSHDQPPPLPKWVQRVIALEPASATQKTILAQVGQLGSEVQTVALSDPVHATDVMILDAEGAEIPEIAAWLDELDAKDRPRILAHSDDVTTLKLCGAGQETLCKPFSRRELLDAFHRLLPPDEQHKADKTTAPAVPDSPAKPDLEPAATDPADASQNAAEGAPRKMRILVAEDNKTNRLVMGKLLKSLNIDLEFAENGQLAVEAWERSLPDLVLMDISMPIMDGKEATRTIRAKAAEMGLPHTPIVAVTAHAVEGDKDEILAAGLDHYLTKPLKKQAIFDRVKVAMPDDVLPVFPDEPADDTAGDLPRAGPHASAPEPDMDHAVAAPGTSDDDSGEADNGDNADNDNDDHGPALDLASASPTILGTAKQDTLQRLSEALNANPVAKPDRPISEDLDQAQDMWNTLAKAEPQRLQADN